MLHSRLNDLFGYLSDPLMANMGYINTATSPFLLLGRKGNKQRKQNGSATFAPLSCLYALPIDVSKTTKAKMADLVIIDAGYFFTCSFTQ